MFVCMCVCETERETAMGWSVLSSTISMFFTSSNYPDKSDQEAPDSTRDGGHKYSHNKYCTIQKRLPLIAFLVYTSEALWIEWTNTKKLVLSHTRKYYILKNVSPKSILIFEIIVFISYKLYLYLYLWVKNKKILSHEK